MRKPANQSPLTESQYQLVAARERHRPLTLKERRAADELIRTSPAAAKYAEALRGRLKEVAKERLQVILGGTGSESAKARSGKRRSMVHVRFADGQREVVTGQPGREFQQLIESLKANATAIASGVNCASLSYTKKLGARRDAIEKCDLLVVDASTFVPPRKRAINALYEIAWARYFEKPIIWACMGKRNQSLSGGTRVTSVMRCLATQHYLPMFKMCQQLKQLKHDPYIYSKLDRYNDLVYGPSSPVDRRFMPDDYLALFDLEWLESSAGREVVVFGLPQIRAQVLQFSERRGDLWHRRAAGIHERPIVQTRARAV
jgi:hypothetical protein